MYIIYILILVFFKKKMLQDIYCYTVLYVRAARYWGKKMDTAICFSVFSVININMIFFIVLGTFKLPISPYLTDSSMEE